MADMANLRWPHFLQAEEKMRWELSWANLSALTLDNADLWTVKADGTRRPSALAHGQSGISTSC